MWKIKSDINQQDFKIVDTTLSNLNNFQWDANSSGWKLQLNNLAVKGANNNYGDILQGWACLNTINFQLTKTRLISVLSLIQEEVNIVVDACV